MDGYSTMTSASKTTKLLTLIAILVKSAVLIGAPTVLNSPLVAMTTSYQSGMLDHSTPPSSKRPTTLLPSRLLLGAHGLLTCSLLVEVLTIVTFISGTPLPVLV
jgi:hypothetical protein